MIVSAAADRKKNQKNGDGLLWFGLRFFSAFVTSYTVRVQLLRAEEAEQSTADPARRACQGAKPAGRLAGQHRKC